MEDNQEFDVSLTDNIFTSDEASEGLKSQAEAIGADPDSVDINKPQKIAYAKKSCSHCSGKGVLVFIPSPAKPKKTKPKVHGILSKAFERQVRRSRVFKDSLGKWRKKPSQKRSLFMTEQPGNALDKLWNTRKKEPERAKFELKEHRPCRCVKILEL